jgi:hypothetical protein
MTTTDDRPAATIQHPDWCYPHQCTARVEDGCRVGYHLRYLTGFTALYGPKLALYLVDDAVFNKENVAVALVTLAHEDDVPVEVRGTVEEHDWRHENGSWVWFEPEEARMLGRFLSRGADEWERVQQGLADGV